MQRIERNGDPVLFLGKENCGWPSGRDSARGVVHLSKRAHFQEIYVSDVVFSVCYQASSWEGFPDATLAHDPYAQFYDFHRRTRIEMPASNY